MNNTVTVDLPQPISFNGETYTKLVFREATAGDARRADGVEGEFSKMLAVLSGMAGVPLDVLDRVPMRLMNEIVEKVGALMGESSPADGQTQ